MQDQHRPAHGADPLLIPKPVAGKQAHPGLVSERADKAARQHHASARLERGQMDSRGDADRASVEHDVCRRHPFAPQPREQGLGRGIAGLLPERPGAEPRPRIVIGEHVEAKGPVRLQDRPQRPQIRGAPVRIQQGLPRTRIAQIRKRDPPSRGVAQEPAVPLPVGGGKTLEKRFLPKRQHIRHASPVNHQSRQGRRAQAAEKNIAHGHGREKTPPARANASPARPPRHPRPSRTSGTGHATPQEAFSALITHR